MKNKTIGVKLTRPSAIYVIEVTDNYTHQPLILTPLELVQLKTILTGAEIDGSDMVANDLAQQQRAFDIYHGHSLPAIDRNLYEAEFEVSPHLRFDLYQVIGTDFKKAGEL